MSSHCSQGTWRAVGCPHHLHPMQWMQTAASHRHDTRVKNMWHTYGNYKKKTCVCFLLSNVVYFCEEKKHQGPERCRSFQLVTKKGNKDIKEMRTSTRKMSRINPPTCNEGTSKQLANSSFPVKLHAFKKQQHCYLRFGGRHVFAYSRLQGLLNPCY